MPRWPAIDDFVFSFTLVMTFIYDFFISFFLIGCILALIFEKFNAANWITAGSIILSSLLAFGVIWLSACLVSWLHKVFKADNLQKCRNNMAIGYGGIAICGIAPRIIVYFIDFNLHLLFFGIIIFPVIANSIYYFFILGLGKSCGLRTKKYGKFIGYSIAAHIILLIITLRIAANYEERNVQTSIVSCQLGCSLICASSTIELFIVMTGGIKMKSNIGQGRRVPAAENRQNDMRGVEPVREQRTETVAPVVDNKSRLECEICALGFSETFSRIPRILKECGHTICEGCAGKLLKKNNGQHLFCPFCKKVTIVNGAASLLPKNYIALDLVQNAV